jgi:hypothetical protein
MGTKNYPGDVFKQEIQNEENLLKPKSSEIKSKEPKNKEQKAVK